MIPKHITETCQSCRKFLSIPELVTQFCETCKVDVFRAVEEPARKEQQQRKAA